MYRRYFQIIDPAMLARIAELMAGRKAYMEGMHAIRDEVGAKACSYWQQSEKLAGFKFEQAPDRAVWSEKKGLWMPKKSTKAGKAILDKIKAVPFLGPIDSVLEMAGLRGDCPSLFTGMHAYYSYVTGHTGERWFASVPWLDEDPAVLEQYRKDNAAGTHYSANLDHLLWTPPAGWVALKEWEVQKALDEDSPKKADAA